MAVDKAPFDDVRVRQAIKLLADRDQLVEVALSGFGQVGNDLFGRGLPFYDSSLPQRTRDVAKAKSLLAAAGHGNGLDITLQTSPASPGMVEAATLLAQQAKAGGVNITISQVDSSSYFDPSLQVPQDAVRADDLGRLQHAFGLLQLRAHPQRQWQRDTLEPGGHDGAHLQGHFGAHGGRGHRLLECDPAAAIRRPVATCGGRTSTTSTPARPKVAGITPSKYLAMGLPSSLTDAYYHLVTAVEATGAAGLTRPRWPSLHRDRGCTRLRASWFGASVRPSSPCGCCRS